MTYKEESYVLDTLKELQERIRDMPNTDAISNLIKEIHENNVMLKAIIKYFTNEAANQENENDFERNVMANMISNIFEIDGLNKI